MTWIIDAARMAGAAILALCCAQVFSAAAQDYPTRRPITSTPPPAGKATIRVMRLVG